MCAWARIHSQARTLTAPYDWSRVRPPHLIHAALMPCPAAQQMGGEVRYNGQLPSEFDLQRTAAYVDQVS